MGYENEKLSRFVTKNAGINYITNVNDESGTGDIEG
jgi:hypothetical protein